MNTDVAAADEHALDRGLHRALEFDPDGLVVSANDFDLRHRWQTLLLPNFRLKAGGQRGAGVGADEAQGRPGRIHNERRKTAVAENGDAPVRAERHFERSGDAVLSPGELQRSVAVRETVTNRGGIIVL